ncbi:MAG TPA: NAD(P)H-dependent glycerol-3-phosphate dehydrogenase [Actinomycetota bacterium]|nr:NAD(P)H-dependent glycerol-3-phosphate dehydrogenase [Actinomycetota bacterium]
MGSVTGEPKVAIIGAGSWGTAFGTITAHKGIDTVLWARRQELADAITARHENPDYLAGIELPPSMTATHDLERCVAEADVLVMAVPSHTYRENFRQILPLLPDDVAVISLAKGIEQDTNRRMSEIMQEEGDLGPARIGVLSGPNLAKEIARRQPAATTLALADHDRCRELQELFMSPTFRVYSNPDVIGCEIGGCTKNVIAIAAGMADGMGFGDNAKASLMTRGLAELARLGVALGGNALTFAGLAGMGDLIATCMSKLSRNRHVGEELGKGRKLDEIISEMNMVAEGVKTAGPVVALAAEHDVDAFISGVMFEVIHGDMTPPQAVEALMLRPPMAELEGIIQA